MNTRTIDMLLDIMADTDMSTHRRIEAAEALLGFEAPAEVVARAREYLAQVSEDKENEETRSKSRASSKPRKSRRKPCT